MFCEIDWQLQCHIYLGENGFTEFLQKKSEIPEFLHCVEDHNFLEDQNVHQANKKFMSKFII